MPVFKIVSEPKSGTKVYAPEFRSVEAARRWLANVWLAANATPQILEIPGPGEPTKWHDVEEEKP